MFAKHAAAHKNLNEQFNQRKIQKTYMAVTHGVIERAIHKIDTDPAIWLRAHEDRSQTGETLYYRVFRNSAI